MATKGNGRSDSGRQKKIDLMLKCLPSLKAFAISLTGNEVRAEDLVQEAVLKALTNLDSFQSGTNMSAWMFTILRNHRMSVWRKLRREQEWEDGFENVLHLSTGLGEGEAEATHDFRRPALPRLLAGRPSRRLDCGRLPRYVIRGHGRTARLCG